MAKKNWIYIKRGLSIDPKHRETMGMCVWLFMLIVDSADWETGIMYDWKDADIAGEMSLNPRTIRDWRQKLDAAGYISCVQKQHNLEIVIHNWNNPRDYSGKKINEFQGDIPTQENNFEGDTQGDTQGLSESVTLPLDSKSKSLSAKDSLKKEIASRGGLSWGVALDLSSEELSRLTELESNIKLKTDEYERCMNYPPLSWGSKDLEPLAKFLAKQSLEDIRRFAEWSKNPFNGLSPAKARQYPKLVIDLWLQATPKETTSKAHLL
jgi:hypothetical protein